MHALVEWGPMPWVLYGLGFFQLVTRLMRPERTAQLAYSIASFVLCTLIVAVFITLWITGKPERMAIVSGALFVYAVSLFEALSVLMYRGLATYLTRKRGEQWIKEIDYVYLSLGGVGVLLSVNRVDFLSGHIDRWDVLASLLLATAVVIRFIKTRAELAGWNKLPFV